MSNLTPVQKFYKQLKNKDNAHKFTLKNDGRFLMEFLNFSLESEENYISKIDLIQTGNLENVKTITIDESEKISDDDIISLSNYLVKKKSESEIYLADSIFSEINTLDGANEKKLNPSTINIKNLKISNNNDNFVSAPNLIHEGINAELIDDESIPKVKINKDYDSYLLVKNKSQKLISSSKDFNLDFDISNGDDEKSYMNIIPSETENQFFIDTLDLGESHTIIEGEKIEFIASSEETRNYLGYEIDSNEKTIYEKSSSIVSSNKNKSKAGKNIKLQFSKDNGYCLNFSSNNIQVEEGELSYDSVLQLARNNILGDDDYSIWYEETLDRKCSFKIDKNNKKIIIYVNEINEFIEGV